MAQAAGVDPTLVATQALIFVALRVLHGIFYVTDLHLMRSFTWTAGFACVLWMMVAAALQVGACVPSSRACRRVPERRSAQARISSTTTVRTVVPNPRRWASPHTALRIPETTHRDQKSVAEGNEMRDREHYGGRRF